MNLSDPSTRAHDRRSPPPSAPDLEAALATPFPVLAGTHLCLELLKGQSSLELKSLTELLSRDPGAVLRLFALVAREFPEATNRPKRLEDCIAGVSRSDLDLALHRPPPSRGEQARMTSFARHAFLIARYAREVAASLGLCTEQAFLAGLLHAIGRLPAEIGRTPETADPEAHAAYASAIAVRYGVPQEIRQAIVEVHAGEPRSVWLAVINAAHDLAAEPPAIDGSGYPCKRSVLETGERVTDLPVLGFSTS